MTRSIDEIKANITAKAQSSEPTTKKQTPPPTTWTAEVVNLADVEAEDISWLWCPYIPLGKVSIVQGDGGLGKSWLTLAIASAVTRGHPLPGQDGTPGTTTSPQTVVILSAEDDLADTIRPRLDALQAAPERVFAIRAKSTIRDDGERIEASITLADVPLLRQEVERLRPTLVVIDPLAAYLGASTDMHRSNEVRPLLAALGDLAAAYDLAVVIVHHLNKNTAAKAAYRGAGSYDIGAAVRSILVVAEDPEDPQKRIIAHAKSNLAAMGASLAFTLREGAFSWAGTSTLTAEQLLAAPRSEEERSTRDEATEWLQDLLQDGPLPVRDLKASASDAGLSWRTVERAKAALGITAKRSGSRPSDPWTWTLSGDSPPLSYNNSWRSVGGVYETPSRTPLSTDRQQTANPSYRGLGGLSAEIGESTDERGKNSPTPPHVELSDDSDLPRRAAALYKTLSRESLEQIRQRSNDCWTRVSAPTWWPATAKTEPLAVTIALELLATDGTRAGPPEPYLAAARAAVAQSAQRQ